LVLEPYVGSAVLAGKLIDRMAQGDVRRTMLADLIGGTTIFGVAHEEAGARGCLQRVDTTARRAGNQYVLGGRKIMVLGGALCDKFLVSARSAGDTSDRAGISLFLIDAQSPGVVLETYRTIDQRLVADVTLNDVEIPADALIGNEGEAIDALELAYDHATVMICAEAVGAMERAFWIARDYLTARKQFGSSLSEFQVLRHRLVDMYVELEMARAIVNSAVSSIDGLDGAPRRMLVAATKARVGRAGHVVGTQAVQLHGGIGMAEEYVIGHYLKRLHVNEALFGNTHVHTGLRASALLAI
jgi:alkylation response protein AidB-like acyl-CoA dehydrogenase